VTTTPTYPGTAHHQKLLQAIASFYADDPRILAVAVFGSLARETWDRFSDLDLDVVIADDVQLDIIEELRHLCDRLASIGEPAALIVSDGDDAGDVVLDSLMEFSICYHSLAATSPNIVDDLRLLAGRIAPATIQRASLQNRRTQNSSPSRRLDACVRYAVGVDVAIQRRQIWMAVEQLHRMRGIVMELFAVARGGARPLKFFEQADASAQARLGATLPQFDLLSAQKSLAQFLDLLENDLARFIHCQLSDAQRRVLQQVRSRQAQLNR
jgi:predicted nucleotidyltransferase